MTLISTSRRLALTLFFGGALVLNAPSMMLGSSTAWAQDATRLREAREELVNSWDHRSNGDRYVFRSNGTYTFVAGRTKRASGNVSHSGTWRVTDYSPRSEEGIRSNVTLRLRSTSRVVLEGSRRRTLKANRRFSMRVTFTEADGLIQLGDQPFYTRDSPERPSNLG